MFTTSFGEGERIPEMIHLLYCNSIKSCYSTEREFEIVTLCNSLSLRPFMKLSVYEIGCIAHAWTEFVAGLLFSPESFCKSADPPWTPGFCSSWFCIREQRYFFGCFSNLLSQINRHYAAGQLFLLAKCMSMAF